MDQGKVIEKGRIDWGKKRLPAERIVFLFPLHGVVRATVEAVDLASWFLRTQVTVAGQHRIYTGFALRAAGLGRRHLYHGHIAIRGTTEITSRLGCGMPRIVVGKMATNANLWNSGAYCFVVKLDLSHFCRENA